MEIAFGSNNVKKKSSENDRYQSSNYCNFFDDFPARMADGRFITDYSPNCDNNMKHKKELSGWEYRQYLTNNAETIMQEINELNDKL